MTNPPKDREWPHADFCGCCGRDKIGELYSSDANFCKECLSHVLPHDGLTFPWDRTYFAQHRKECPFQVGAGLKEKTDETARAD